MQVLTFVFVLVCKALLTAASCTSSNGEARYCQPLNINAAYGREVVATSTCGSPAEEYCVRSTRFGQPPTCYICDAKDYSKSHNASYLTDPDNGFNTWWQSASMMNEVQYPNVVNLTLDFGKIMEVSVVRIIFKSSRPESLAIYKKKCLECEWQPYQYYSSSCQAFYHVPNEERLQRGENQKVRCTEEYSNISPLSGGAVVFSTLEARPAAFVYNENAELQEWTTVSALRISLARINTFGDEVSKDSKILRSYYYAISDVGVNARCKCNGHASQCYVNSDSVFRCQCEHNTAGQDCERCADFYNDLPWKKGTDDNPGKCAACNCSGKSQTCYFDDDLYQRTGHGGHCTNCQENTHGPNCQLCLPNFYRDDDANCQPCGCDEQGSVQPQCDDSGQCLCRRSYTGQKCDTMKTKNRVYYLAIKEILYDFAPTGLNLVTNNRFRDETLSSVFTETFIGKQYIKAVFRRYTDETYQTEVSHDPNLGFMGPILRAEVGDNITVHLFNNASREFSLHPHGVFYTKSHEGAKYQDNSDEISDDAVPSGESQMYHWEVRPEYGPTQDDPNCLTWAYHSHVNSPKDINSGLIGPLIVCRPGTYREDDSRSDVDHEFVSMFFVVNERDSWYFRQNLLRVPNWQNLDIENSPEFEESNKMHSINGYVFGNTPGYEVCQGDTISWHVMGMGSNDDLHSIHFQGQTMMTQHHRKDSMIVIPASFSTVTLRVNNPGRWLVSCKLYTHFTEGMSALMTVDESCRNPDVPLPSSSLDGKTRTFFMAAEEVLWNYAPSELNKLTNESLLTQGSDSEVFYSHGPKRIGGVYKKAVFREYTDESFTVAKNRPFDLGILGPVIAGEVGDTLKIVFKNTATNRAFNMEPHGVYFRQRHPTPPNLKRTYIWTLPDDVAPSDNDPNCLTYIYTSSVSYIADSNAGLIGPLQVCKRGTLESEMKKEHRFILMTVFDENRSWYIDENIETFAPTLEDSDKDEDFEESNLMHSINGLMYGNLELNLCADRDTTLHVMSVGSDVDMHGIDLEGINVKTNGVNTGVIQVFAHTFNSATLRPSYIGSGRMFCRTIDHTITGMSAIYNSVVCNANSTEVEENQNMMTESNGNPYYIAATEEIWDYNQRGVNIQGISTDIRGVAGYLYSHHEPGRFIGSHYKKVLYFEYTDETFTTRKPKPAHLGLLGPIIQGEVGKPISVVFFNNASRPYNMFPWGAVDPSANSKDPHPVQPGETKRYLWQVPESASPSKNQTDCQSFVYVSNVDAAIDPIDGLIGPLLVCKKGTFPGETVPAYEPTSVDEEFFLLFLNFDENLSHYLNENIRLFLNVNPDTFQSNEDFEESNKMKAINGYLWHVEDLTMKTGDLVRWHLIGWGNEEDYHSVHFHAHTYVYVSETAHRGDVFDVFPGFIGTVVMQTNAPGDWLLHCHVFDHLHSGMQTVYSVVEGDAAQRDEVIPAPIKTEKICKIIIRINKTEYNCDGNNFTKIQDFTTHRLSKLSASFENGTKISADVKSVQVLSLANNLFTKQQVAKVLRVFTNLRELNLDENRLRILPKGFFRGNPKLHSVSLKKNLDLVSVSKRLLDDANRRERPKYHVISRLDLSENNLKPPCRNAVFTDTKTFLACFKKQKIRRSEKKSTFQPAS